jgi:hypothetical protein
MTTSNLKEKILARVLAVDWVSFADLMTFPGFSDPENGFSIMHGKFENVVLWSGISEAGVTALRELRAETKIHWEPKDMGGTGMGSGFMDYIIDGATSSLPLVKTAKNYAKPHWLPVFYRPGPIPLDLLSAAERRKALHPRIDT